MADVFVEQIVKRKRTVADIVKIVLVILAALALMSTFLVVNMLRMVFPFVFAASIYFAYQFIRQMSIEYEYSVNSGELDVDKIAGRRKRTHVLTVSVRRFSILAPATEKYAAEYGSDAIKKTVDACISPNSEGLWFARFEDDGGVENVLFFNPGEKVLRTLAKTVPSKVRELPPEFFLEDEQ